MPKSIKYYINICFIAVAILWPVLKIEYFQIDGKGRVELLMAAVAIIVNIGSFFKCPKAMFFWLIWVVFGIINSSITGFVNEKYSLVDWAAYHLVYPYVTMIITYLTVKEYPRVYNLIFIFFFFYVLLGAIGMDMTEVYGSAKGLTNTMGNSFLNVSILLVTYAGLTNTNGKLPGLLLYVISILELFIIFKTGERKGLVGLFIVILGVIISRNWGKDGKVLLRMIFLLAIVFVGFSYVLRYSLASERMTESMSNSAFSDSFFLQLMGDRAIMYYEGWELFLSNTLTGIGLTNAQWKGGLSYGMLLHTEYMVQLAECGLVGSFLFLMFYYGILKRMIRMLRKKLAVKETIILFSTFLAIIMINFVAWSYDNAFYFMLYGVMFAHYDINAMPDIKRKRRL